MTTHIISGSVITPTEPLAVEMGTAALAQILAAIASADLGIVSLAAGTALIGKVDPAPWFGCGLSCYSRTMGRLPSLCTTTPYGYRRSEMHQSHQDTFPVMGGHFPPGVTDGVPSDGSVGPTRYTRPLYRFQSRRTDGPHFTRKPILVSTPKSGLGGRSE